MCTSGSKLVGSLLTLFNFSISRLCRQSTPRTYARAGQPLPNPPSSSEQSPAVFLTLTRVLK